MDDGIPIRLPHSRRLLGRAFSGLGPSRPECRLGGTTTGVSALYAEDVPGSRLSDVLGWVAVNSEDPAAVLPVFEGIREGRLLLQIDGEVENNPFEIFPEGSKIEVIPASTRSGQSSGLEEEGMERLRTAVEAFQRLPEVQIRSGIGIVAAGLEGEEELVYGLALLKRGRTFEERPAPVVFLTRDERQTVLLRAADWQETLVGVMNVFRNA